MENSSDKLNSVETGEPKEMTFQDVLDRDLSNVAEAEKKRIEENPNYAQMGPDYIANLIPQAQTEAMNNKVKEAILSLVGDEVGTNMAEMLDQAANQYVSKYLNKGSEDRIKALESQFK